jgi:hypothetical protein
MPDAMVDVCIMRVLGIIDVNMSALNRKMKKEMYQHTYLAKCKLIRKGLLHGYFHIQLLTQMTMRQGKKNIKLPRAVHAMGLCMWDDYDYPVRLIN